MGVLLTACLAAGPERAPMPRELDAVIRAATRAVREADWVNSADASLQRPLARLRDLVRQFPAAPASADALAALANYVPAGELIALHRRHHPADPTADRLCGALAQSADPAARRYAEELGNAHPDRAVRGRIALTLGRVAMQYVRWRSDHVGPPAEVADRADRYLRRAATDYADVPAWDGRTVGEWAAQDLAGLRNRPALAVGGTAPDLAGEEPNGRPLGLADYRDGRAAVVVFWYPHHEPSVALDARLRAVRGRLGGRCPRILGVAVGSTRPVAAWAVIDHRHLWPSLWDDGRLAATWNVVVWPSVWVIDAGGVVRYAGRGDGLEAAVEKVAVGGP